MKLYNSDTGFIIDCFISDLFAHAERNHQTPYEIVLALEKRSPISAKVKKAVLERLSDCVCEVPRVSN